MPSKPGPAALGDRATSRSRSSRPSISSPVGLEYRQQPPAPQSGKGMSRSRPASSGKAAKELMSSTGSLISSRGAALPKSSRTAWGQTTATGGAAEGVGETVAAVLHGAETAAAAGHMYLKELHAAAGGPGSGGEYEEQGPVGQKEVQRQQRRSKRI